LGHDLPPPPQYLENAPFGARWYEDTMIPWLDYWLKGVGRKPDLGVVDWQDQTMAWHRAKHPDAAHDGEVLYLTGNSLSPAPGPGGAGRLLASTLAVDRCAPAALPGALVYSVQSTEPVLLHGSPVLLLTLQSSMPRGSFYARLLVSNGSPCSGTDVDSHGGGAVDLRYHAGGYQAIPFPATPQKVRVDLGSIGLRLDPDQTLSIVLEAGIEAPSSDGGALITVLETGDVASSQLLLPIAEGSLGGTPPTVTYPKRPFSPEPGPHAFQL
jgi:hypothetical protein